MPIVTPTYSTLFQCLYDEEHPITRRFPPYSVFRAIDSRNVLQEATPRPRVHDFAVIWDDDHDTRIIAVLEEMLMAGALPGVQFIGEHKGTLSVILAAATYYVIDVEAYKKWVTKLAEASGDFWMVEIGMFDHSPGNLARFHQCDFVEIVGGDDADKAFLFTIDAAWRLGTKAWRSIDMPAVPPSPGVLFPRGERYFVERPQRHAAMVFAPPPPLPLPPLPPVRQ